jgi:hypothetical protein
VGVGVGGESWSHALPKKKTEIHLSKKGKTILFLRTRDSSRLRKFQCEELHNLYSYAV